MGGGRGHLVEEQKTFRFTNLTGLLCTAFARRTRENCIRLYSPDTFELLFSAEMYYGFDRQFLQLEPCFYAFEYGNGFIGLSFGDEKSAQDFASSVKMKSPKKEDWEKIVKEKATH